jgi:hypothetical protein
MTFTTTRQARLKSCAGSILAASTPARSPAPLARSHDDFDRIAFSEDAREPTPAKPASAAESFTKSTQSRLGTKRCPTAFSMQDLSHAPPAKAPSRTGDMSAIVYVDTSDVREGALERLKAGMKELADFVEANEPRLLAYYVYFSDDGARMTVVHVHPDSASVEYHMEVAGPIFRQLMELVTLSSIHIYGEPSVKLLAQSHEKARLLGRDDVTVDALHAGFTRFAVG